MQSKDASWHEIVTLVLGPPRQLDFQEEATQRARRKRIKSLKILPSDDQCRFLWKFHASCDSFNRVKCAAAENNETNISEAGNAEKLKNEGIATMYPKKKQIHNDASAKRKLSSTESNNSIKSNNRVSLSPPRERPRTQPRPPSSPGWITKSSFYSDDTKRSTKDQDVDFPDEVGIATKQKRSRQVDSPEKQRLQKCDYNSFDTNEPQSPKNKRKVNRDDSSVDLDSPEEKLSARRPNKKLFRPSVRRANSRFKQSSILHLFGKK